MCPAGGSVSGNALRSGAPSGVVAEVCGCRHRWRSSRRCSRRRRRFGGVAQGHLKFDLCPAGVAAAAKFVADAQDRGGFVAGNGVGPYSVISTSLRVTTVNSPDLDRRNPPAGHGGIGPGEPATMNDCPVIAPVRIASSTSSASGVLLYRVTVYRPRESARTSSGVPIGSDARSDGVPCNVRPWL